MKEKISMFFTFVRFRALMNLQYPAAYWLEFLGQIITYGANFCVIAIAVSSFGELNGWRAEEILLLYAFELISYAIGAFFCFHPSTGLAGNIRTGSFDISLTKPMNPFVYQILYYGLDIAYLSHFVLALGVMIYALIQIAFVPTLWNVLLLSGGAFVG